jgi:predicted  nucleic acid-binding Zn-ribbon protein
VGCRQHEEGIMSDTTEGSQTKESCSMHNDMMAKLDRALEGMIKLGASLPVQIAEINSTLRDLRTMIIDKTELLFKLDKEKQEKIAKLETDIALIKAQKVPTTKELADLNTGIALLNEHKMPQRLFRLENWRAYVLGGLATATLLANLGLTIWSILHK